MKLLLQILIKAVTIGYSLSSSTVDGDSCEPQTLAELAQLTKDLGEVELTTASGEMFQSSRKSLLENIEIERFDTLF